MCHDHKTKFSVCGAGVVFSCVSLAQAMKILEVIAAIDLSRAKLGWVYHMDSPISKEMELTVLSEWHSPLYNARWTKGGVTYWSIQKDEGENVLQFVTEGDGIILTKETELTDYRA